MMKAIIHIFRFAILSVAIQVFAAPLLDGLPTSEPSDRQHIKSRDDTNSAWAGAFQTPACSSNPNDYIWQVQAQWIIPNFYSPSSDSGAGRWWVNHQLAIDGVVAGCTAQAAIGGISMNVAYDDYGVTTQVVQGFYQYYPDPVQIFDLAFAVGDHVQMTISTFFFPPTFTIFNLSANKSAVAMPSTKQPMSCGKNGAFIVANPSSNGVPSPMAAFDDFEMDQIVFTYYANDCGLDGATLIQMVQNNNQVVTATTQSNITLGFHSDI